MQNTSLPILSLDWVCPHLQELNCFLKFCCKIVPLVSLLRINLTFSCRQIWEKANRRNLQDFIHILCCFSVCSCCLSGRFWDAGWALVIHIKWLFNGASSISWQCWGVWGRWMAISVSDWRNWNEAQGLLPQTFHRGGKLKREEKILANNSCLSPGSPSQGLNFLISSLQFSRNFFHCFSPRH